MVSPLLVLLVCKWLSQAPALKAEPGAPDRGGPPQRRPDLERSLAADRCCSGDQVIPGERPGLSVVIAATQGKDVSWVLQQPYEANIVSDRLAGGGRRHGGREAGSYMRYIVTHYDSLPERMVFMHDHRSAWELPDSVRLLKSLDPTSYEYAGLNRWFEIESDSQDRMMARDFLTLLLNLTVSPRDHVRFYSGAAFLVSRARVQNVGLGTWQRWYAQAQDVKDDPDRSSFFGYGLEELWHAIFGEDPAALRPRDPSKLCPADPAACAVYPWCRGCSICDSCKPDPQLCPADAVGPCGAGWLDPAAHRFVGASFDAPCSKQALEWWRSAAAPGAVLREAEPAWHSAQRRRRRRSASLVLPRLPSGG